MILSIKNNSKLLWFVLFCIWAVFPQTLIICRTAGVGRGPSSFLSTTFNCSRLFRHLQLGKYDDYVVILIASHIIIKLMLDKIYLPSGTSIWLNVNSSLNDDLTLHSCYINFSFSDSELRANWLNKCASILLLQSRRHENYRFFFSCFR